MKKISPLSRLLNCLSCCNCYELPRRILLKKYMFFIFLEAKTLKGPKRVIMKATNENKEHIDNDGFCFSPRSLFALPPDGSSFVLDSLHFVDESSDQDLLLDVPSNCSFPQAELLHPALSFGQQASTSSSSAHPHLVHP